MAGNDPEYMRDYRARNPEYVAGLRRRNKARARAARRLTQVFPREFHALFSEELARVEAAEGGGPVSSS